MSYERNYLNLLSATLNMGAHSVDRTGVGTFSLFGEKLTADLNEEFPLLQTKRVYWKGVVEELLWILRGETNSRTLEKKGVNIWREWADDNGDLGPVYGAQWRGYDGYPDQVQALMVSLATQPHSRRHIICAWQPRDLDKMALPPCHAFVQFYVKCGELSCQLYQRSADLFLGVPFNVASYSLLTHLIAHQLGLRVGLFHHVFGDAHVYSNHVDAVSTQLLRDIPTTTPQLIIKTKREHIWDYEFEDFELIDYKPLGAIKAPVAV